jgi:threonine synthase
MIHCLHCNAGYPEQGVPYLCQICGGIFDCDAIQYRPENTVDGALPGIWRYRHTFDFPSNAPVISLGEGNTPLVWSDAFGYPVAFKCEYQNPTGSFKDRGSATLVSFLRARGITQAVEDSSGNAGASLAAYAARAGLQVSVYIPETASGPKRKQIEAYGAEVIPVPGPRSNSTDVVRKVAGAEVIYASHAYLPFNLPGYATIAYEIVEQLGESPGIFICPAGQGGLLLGASRGFTALKAAGIIHRYPILVGVQALACAPLFDMDQQITTSWNGAGDEYTLAEGVRVRSPLRSVDVVQEVKSSGGRFLAIAEADILSGRDELARRGFYVETTSAIVWNGLSQVVSIFGTHQLPEPIVVVLTGSGLKTV